MKLSEKIDAQDIEFIEKLRGKSFESKEIRIRKQRLQELSIYHYEYLKFSPSYHRVFKDKSNEGRVLPHPDVRTLEEKRILIKNYYGDVWKNTFQEQYERKFIPSQYFTVPRAYRHINWLWIHKVDSEYFEESEILDFVKSDFEALLKFKKENNHVFLQVPLQGNKRNLLSEISDVLDVMGFDNKKENKERWNRYEPASKRINFKALTAGIQLLYDKSNNPNLELWRLGLLSNVSPVYSKLLDPNSSRKISNTDEEIYRDNLAKLTHRALKKYESIAENAAYGNFPSSTPKSTIKFDYVQIAKRLNKKRA